MYPINQVSNCGPVTFLLFYTKKINQLELDESLVVVPKSHPAARRRYINFPPFTLLPSSLPALLASPASNHPTLRALLPAILREPFRPPNQATAQVAEDDESVYSLVARRFGDEFARQYLSAILHGIYAADARSLSVRATFPFLWEAERKGRGSILRGFARNAISQPKWSLLSSISRVRTLTESRNGTGKSSLALSNDKGPEPFDIGNVAAKLKGAAMYTFKGGIETLSSALYKSLSEHPNVEIWQGVGAKQVIPREHGIEVGDSPISFSLYKRFKL